MIGRRGFIGAVTGLVAGVFAAARGAFAAARDVKHVQVMPLTWPQLGDRVIIRQWFPSRGPVDWTMTVSGISYQASNDMQEPADFTLLLSGYQDPGDGLGRRTFNLSLGMDQCRFSRPGDQLRIDWWPWGRP